MAQYSKSKISHTILEFGRELILGLPEPNQKHELEACMSIVVMVWNAVTLDTIRGSKENAQMVLEAMKNEPPEMVLLIKRLIMRKKRKYGADLRGIGETWIVERNGELVFGCDARAVADLEQANT